MSFRAVAWALDVVRGLNPTEKLVLIALAEFANDEDVTWRSSMEVAARAECSERSVKSHLAALEAHGLLQREPIYAWCGLESKCAGRSPHKHRSGTRFQLSVGGTNFTGIY